MIRKVAIGLGALLALVALVGVRPDLPAEQVDAEYHSADSRFATLADGTRMHYWDRGKRRGPVLVLLHGAYDSASTFESWAALLEREFRLIVPDLPAHGLTGRTATGDYSIGGMVASVHGLLDTLAISRVSIAGNSMGGYVAWRFALKHPGQVERLVLIDSAGYPGLDPAGPRASSAVVRTLYRYANPRPLVRRGFTEVVADERLITDKRLDRWVAFVRREGSRDAQIARMADRAQPDDAYRRMHTIEQPTLVLWGERDPRISLDHAHKFERDLPHAKLIVYPRVGHMPQLELPERSSGDAREFLLAAAPLAAAF